MGKWGWQKLRKRVPRLPSPGAILQVVLVEIVVNVIWNYASKKLSEPIVRDVGFLVLSAIGLVGVFWFLGRKGQLLGKGKPPNQRVQPDGHDEWVQHFDRLFRFEINQVHLRGLWKDDISHGVEDNPEPFVRFQIVIYNNTGLQLQVVGCRGSITIDGDACTLAAVLEPPTVDLSPWTYQTPTIKQPLLGGRGEDLINAIGTSRRVRVSLSSVQLFVEGDGFPQRPVGVGIGFEMDGTGVEPATGIDGLSKSPLLVKRP